MIALLLHLENNKEKLKASKIKVSELVWSLEPLGTNTYDYILISDW
jgi:hypothetical protein